MDEKSKELITKIESDYENVKPIIIANEMQYKEMDNILAQIKKRYNELEAKRKEMIKPITEAGKKINGLFSRPKEILKKAERTIKDSLLDYRNRITETNRKIQEELNKKAEEERRKLEERARKAEDNGKEEKAELLRIQAETIVAPIVNNRIELNNSTVAKWWKFEIENEKIIPREYLMIDTVKIGKIVRASGGTLSIPGVRIYYTEDVRMR